MSYRNLAECVRDLEESGQLIRIGGFEVDPHLEAASILRRARRKGSPALLFTRVKGSPFPMLANLFGNMERTRYIFRHTLAAVEHLLSVAADPQNLLRHPLRSAKLLPTLWHMLPKKVGNAPVMECRTALGKLPQQVSWPRDGGGYITLPQVYTENPDKPGFFASNLGMYRVQMSGGSFEPDKEAGLHYQIHRGIGPHHLSALSKGRELPVNVFVGGPPALTLAAIMPLPEKIPEILFAGALAGRRVRMCVPDGGVTSLPLAAEADFCICGALTMKNGKAVTKPEGPFGDHLGYYSLEHDFPVMRVDAVYHRKDAIWPYTAVGRPPQEDTVFGKFIHELTAEMIPTVFSGVEEVHAVDAAGVHPLLLAIGRERYVPFAGDRMPQELLTCGFSLLGTTQTSLTKYLLAAAREDSPELKVADVPGFFEHMLTRTDFSRDLHFVTRTTMDTLDYSGISLNQGSKLLWAAAGKPLRKAAEALPSDLALAPKFSNARLFAPGIMLCEGPAHGTGRNKQDPSVNKLAKSLEATLPQFKDTEVKDLKEEICLVVVVDDVEFAASSWENFLWVTFTRSDPATDLYGCRSGTNCKHWGCSAPLIIDARMKSFHAPALEEDPDVERRIDELAAPGRPLYGLV